MEFLHDVSSVWHLQGYGVRDHSHKLYTRNDEWLQGRVPYLVTTGGEFEIESIRSLTTNEFIVNLHCSTYFGTKYQSLMKLICNGDTWVRLHNKKE